MSYVLSGVVAEHETLAMAEGLVGVPLSEGMTLIPLTAGFWKARHVPSLPLVDALERGADVGAGFWRATAPFARLSTRSPVAYVEAEFWAGEGSQLSVVWRAGEVAQGPLYAPDAISVALRALGVRALGSDEFDALGLGRHRAVDDWLRG